jgi:hypothetical protein
VPVGKLALESLLGVGSFHLVDLGVHIGIDRRQAQLLGALQENLVGDQAGQQIQLLRHDQVLVGGFRLLRYCVW